MTDNTSGHGSTDAWARYWAGGALHSCVTSFDGNYRGAIAAFWQAVFADLGDRARVLDIATGNGALPQLLLQTCSADGVTCDAVDLAPVAPGWLDALPAALRQRVRIQGGVAAESLPYPSGTFDLVVSQYGIEYARAADALAEVRRVLRRPAGAAFIVHHAGSQPVALARDEIGHIDWLLEHGGLVDAASAMLEPMARAQTPQGRLSLATDASANAARERFNRLQRTLGDRAEGATCPDVLFESRHALAAAIESAARQGLTAGTRRLEQWRQALLDNRVRLIDLCRCAMDESSLRAWLAGLGADEISVAEVLESRPSQPQASDPQASGSQALMGWAVRARLSSR